MRCRGVGTITPEPTGEGLGGWGCQYEPYSDKLVPTVRGRLTVRFVAFFDPNQYFAAVSTVIIPIVVW